MLAIYTRWYALAYMMSQQIPPQTCQSIIIADGLIPNGGWVDVAIRDEQVESESFVLSVRTRREIK